MARSDASNAVEFQGFYSLPPQKKNSTPHLQPSVKGASLPPHLRLTPMSLASIHLPNDDKWSYNIGC